MCICQCVRECQCMCMCRQAQDGSKGAFVIEDSATFALVQAKDWEIERLTRELSEMHRSKARACALDVHVH